MAATLRKQRNCWIKSGKRGSSRRLRNEQDGQDQEGKHINLLILPGMLFLAAFPGAFILYALLFFHSGLEAVAPAA